MRNNKISTGVKIIVFTFFVFSGVTIIILYPYRYRIKNKIVSFFTSSKIINLSTAPCESCDQLFTDGISVHELAYKKEGIKSQKNSVALRNLESKGVLKKITTNDYYIVRDMDYSDPLLLPKAADLLLNISRLYVSEIEKAGLKYIPFEITSATRTIESIKRLKQDNNNAIKNSAHLKGKTFDIGYINFANYPRQRALFINVLKALREENKCFVKYEMVQKCFHITAN
ncbi:MAG: DUF5715 family protein [bacterium]|jgi:hypothetical protein